MDEARPRLRDYEKALAILPEETLRWEKEKKEHEDAVAAAKAKNEKPPKPGFFVRKGPMGPDHFHRPYALYNGRIAPIAPFPVKGVVWYQGEGNTQRHRAPYYDDILRELMSSWREAWQDPTLHFLVVQLPRFVPGPNNDWPSVRASQFEVANEDPHASIVVTIDTGDPDRIHPTGKKNVAARVTRAAKAYVYGENIVGGGPCLESAELVGGELVLAFSNAGSGLLVPDGTGSPAGFEISLDGKTFLPAKTRIKQPDEVGIRVDGRQNPVAVRYAWANLPEVSLTNSEGLPAAPFLHSLAHE